MDKVYLESNNIISSLGWSTNENFLNILAGKTGLKRNFNPLLSDEPIPLSTIDDDLIKHTFCDLGDPEKYTRFEQLAILSITDALKESKIDPTDQNTGFILSTTKGNVALLATPESPLFSKERVTLWKSAEIIADFFGFRNRPLILSNACTSGVASMSLARRLIASKLFENMVVTGIDELSKFIISGFQSFKSLSPEPCKPFDDNRDGLSLGEGAATGIFTLNKSLLTGDKIELVSGTTSNDANHISGPAQDGEGLLMAIKKTLSGWGHGVDHISPHGTATPFNDDMESIALCRAGLDNVPTTGLKGFFGHTLGAAGVIETLIGIESLKRNTLLKTMGLAKVGVAEKINVVEKNDTRELKTLLKLASGFGGFNAVALFMKHA